MKIIIVLVVLLRIQNAAYAQTPTTGEIALTEKNVSGKWVFKDLIDADVSQQERTETKDFMEGIFLDLRQDKTCVTSFVLDLDGTWTLDPTAKTITTKDEKGTVVWTIHSLKANEITLSRSKAATRKIVLDKG